MSEPAASSPTLNDSIKKKENDTKSILRRDNEEYNVIKKLPKRFPSQLNDIYVTSRTNFKAQLEKCQKLMEKSSDNDEEKKIFLHAMGPAINR